MKSFKKLLAITFAVLLVAATFTGCKNDSLKESIESVYDGPVSAVIGVANTVNNASIDVDNVLGKKLEEMLAKNGSSISYYEIDGECYKLGNTKCEYQAGSSKSNKKAKLKTNLFKVSKAIKEAIPKTAEIDMLYALTTMASAVINNAYGTSNPKEMIIVSNLISTKGPINFVDNTIYFDTDNYAEFLKDNMPDMTGINVTWFVTEATGSQEKLENKDKNNIKHFYAKLITNAGGTVEFIDERGGDDTVDRSSWPNVSVVDIRRETFNNANLDVTLEECTLFKPDSTEWVNEVEAERVLQELVDVINSSSSMTVVAGSTATTSSSEQQHAEFSKKRADKVKDKLISLGADENKIVSIGIGKSYEKYRVPDVNEFDNEENKAKNRCVFIVSGDTEKAQYFMNVAEKFDINK